MSQWTDRISSHAAFHELTGIEGALDQAVNLASGDPDVIGSIDRAGAVIRKTASVLRSTDPAIIPPAVIANVHSYLQHARSELQAFVNDGNAGHLTNANSHLDSLLQQIAQIPYGASDETLAGAQASVAAVRAASQTSIAAIVAREAQLLAQIGALDTRVQELVGDIANQKVRLDAAISQQQEQFAQNEEARRAAAARSQQERDAAVAEEVKSRSTTFDALIDTQTAEVQQLLSSIASGASETHRRIEAEFKQLTLDTEAQLQRAREIVGIISESGMVHGYRRVADDERKSANGWHWIAGVSMTGLIGFAIFAFVETLGGAFSWATFAGRAFVAVTFGILAAYAARQADKHQLVERHSRRLELELAALDPFLEPLPEAERISVKKSMADKLFGQPEAMTVVAASETTGSVIDLLKLAIQGLSKR
jgi:hypothetical protein